MAIVNGIESWGWERNIEVQVKVEDEVGLESESDSDSELVVKLYREFGIGKSYFSVGFTYLKFSIASNERPSQRQRRKSQIPRAEKRGKRRSKVQS